MDRRSFLKIAAATSSAVVAASCGRSPEKALPYLVPPQPERIPGLPVFYHSTCTECPANCGLVAKVYDKIIQNAHVMCPVKLDGIPGHPINQGALCIRGQASLNRLYHPERIQQPMRKKANGEFEPLGWMAALKLAAEKIEESRVEGRTTSLLTGKTTGSLAALIDDFAHQTGTRNLPEYEPYSYAALHTAYRQMFNLSEIPLYRIEKADFLLTLSADILETFLNPVQQAGMLTQAKQHPDFSWIHLEPHVSLTGLNATARHTLKPGSEPYLLLYLLHEIVPQFELNQDIAAEIQALPPMTLETAAKNTGLEPAGIHQIARKLHRSRHPLLIAGSTALSSRNGLFTAQLTVILQKITGMIPDTIDFSQAISFHRSGSLSSLEEFTRQPNPGLLIVTRTDPLHTLPPAIPFQEAMQRATFRIGMDLLLTKTLQHCDLILPISHPLESWGDAEPAKNIHSAIQPATLPLLSTQMEGGIYLALLRQLNLPAAADYRTHLFSRWNAQMDPDTLSNFLQNGYRIQDVQAPETEFIPGAILSCAATTLTPPVTGITLIIAPSLRDFDGRSSNLPLLREIPDPLSTITTDDYLSVSPSLAARHQAQDGSMFQITSKGVTISLPIKVQPMLPSEIVLAHRSMMPASVLSFDPVQPEAISLVESIQLNPVPGKTAIPVLSGSPSQKGRGIIPQPVSHPQHSDYTDIAGLYEKAEYKKYNWAMAIDLNRCTGCSACVAACYIENNVPMTGRNEHLKGREMSWLRIEPYYESDGAHFLPMMCQQCDYAPCEAVCPVYATYHNPEGLNAQIYNRCVGTRYCANNCPFKVRRFNWSDHIWPENTVRMLNPEIFARGRGVMEKCTFCVQRIRAAKDRAKDEKRDVQDGDFTSACAQTCPSKAIVFGNLNDPSSEIARLVRDQKPVQILAELGIGPTVFYLPKLNKNPSEQFKHHGDTSHPDPARQPSASRKQSAFDNPDLS